MYEITEESSISWYDKQQRARVFYFEVRETHIDKSEIKSKDNTFIPSIV